MKSALIIVGLMTLIALAFERNALITDRNRIDERWTQVDTDMRQRADLIPTLIETVKGYTKQDEAEAVIGEVSNAREALLSARARQNEIAANNRLSSDIGGLLALKESYPLVKSNEDFLRLEDELEESENRIAVDRRDYNDAIQKYNLDIDLFPSSLAATLFGFHRDDTYFKATQDERKVPQAKF